LCFQIPKEFQTYGEEVFLKFSGWNGDEHVQIFATEKGLDALESEGRWSADATWGAAPLLYDNVWIIFIRVGQSYVPVVFCLLTRRQQSTY
jgi:hypothetical protein